MKEKTYTHKDLATLINVSETTIKSYRKKFPNCLPIVNTGKPIRFTHEALRVCTSIRDLFHQGMAIGEVHARLANEFSWITPPEHVDSPKIQSNNSHDISIPINAIAQGTMTLLQQQKDLLRRFQELESMVLQSHTESTQKTQQGKESGIPIFLLEYPLVMEQNGQYVGVGMLPRFTLLDLVAIVNHNFMYPTHYTATVISQTHTTIIRFQQQGVPIEQSFSIELLPMKQGAETVLLLVSFLVNNSATPLETLTSFIRS